MAECHNSPQVSHNASTVTHINYWRNVLKKSDDLVILGVTFDSKMTLRVSLLGFQKSFSKAWYLEEVLSSLDCFFGDAFGVLSCPFWSTALQCGARLPIHTLNYWTV